MLETVSVITFIIIIIVKVTCSCRLKGMAVEFKFLSTPCNSCSKVTCLATSVLNICKILLTKYRPCHAPYAILHAGVFDWVHVKHMSSSLFPCFPGNCRGAHVINFNCSVRILWSAVNRPCTGGVRLDFFDPAK